MYFRTGDKKDSCKLANLTSVNDFKMCPLGKKTNPMPMTYYLLVPKPKVVVGGWGLPGRPKSYTDNPNNFTDPRV